MLVYLDNAATSYPKPAGVSDAVKYAIENLSGNPLRGNHKGSLKTNSILIEARENLKELFNIKNTNNIIFTLNATEGLNIGINGIKYKKDDEVITSDMEHNSVRRPLNYFAKKIGIKIIKIKTDHETGIDVKDVEKKITKKTKLLVFTHASNVSGVINDIKSIGKLAKKYSIPFLVDASQTAGILDIDVEDMNISILVAPGHKGLLGPTGTGFIYIKEGLNMLPFKYGGTGVYSEDELMPKNLPYKFEAGTSNIHSIAGLNESLKFIIKTGTKKIYKKESEFGTKLYTGLKKIKGVKIYSPSKEKNRVGTISFNVKDFDPTDLSSILDSEFNISLRSGLHCAPDAHENLGTLKNGGTLRVSVSYFNTPKDIDYFLASLKKILS